MYINIPLEQIETYIMVFVRTGAILFTAPMFGSRNIPYIAKTGFALLVAWAVFPSVSNNQQVFSANWFELFPGFFAEIMIGILIGITVRLIFEGIQLAGQLVGFQMGFGIVNVIDPQSGTQFSVIAQLENIFATLLFLSLSMHHWFIKGIALSFEKVPIFHFSLSKPLLQWFIDLSSNMFIVAVKVGAPVIAILLFTSVALGLISRTVPQMNIFIVGFPLKIAIGLFAVGISLPVFSFVMSKLFGDIGGFFYAIFRLGVPA